MPETKPAVSIGSIATPAIVAAVIGLGFVGWQQSAKNEQDNISNLPALVARVNALENRLEQEVDGIEAQINRRENENREEWTRGDQFLSDRLTRDERRLDRIEEQFLAGE